MIKLKIVIGGSKGVGKTSLIRRAVDDRFEADTLSTIGVEFEVKTITVNDPSASPDPIKLQFSIWDFAGENKFRQLFPAYCSGASAAFLLFDITDPSSFQDLDNWLSLVKNAESDLIICLIASKIDLEDQRQISRKHALKFKKKHKMDLYKETSAKEGLGIQEAFDEIAKILVKRSLQTCPHCGQKISKNLILCTHCGKKVIDTK
ncbi:MAG: GTP-binding protein [Candidatus Lokiarchaeota archaeon]|nr:GTP-binding protein [Candidatus Lokiarchaeota archaeon]